MAKKTAVSQEVRDHATDLKAQAEALREQSGLLIAKADVLHKEAIELDSMADKWENAKGGDE